MEQLKGRMKVDAIIQQYAQWLFPLINKAGCGVKYEGHPIHLNSKNRIIESLNGRKTCFLESLSKMKIADHCDGSKQFYFTGSKGTRTLVMLDVDTHNAEPGGMAAVERLLELFPGAFHQGSPRGHHVYIVVAKGDFSDPQVNDILRRLGRFLEGDRKRLDIKVSGVEVKGLIQTIKHEGNKVVGVNCGTLASLPVVMSSADLDRLRSTWSGSVLDVLLLLPQEREEIEGFVECDRNTPSLSISSDKRREREENKDYMGVTTPTVLREMNGWDKKLLCISGLTRRMNRSLTAHEAMVEYEEHYQPTGTTEEDRSRRIRDVSKVVEHFNSSFRPASRHTGQFVKGQYIDIVQQVVPVQEFEWKRREKLDHERLADFVGVKVQDAFYAQEGKKKMFGRASRDASIANMRALKSKGIVSWIANAHTYQRLLDIAVTHGLLKVYEEHVRPMRAPDGRKIVTGIPRLIGPGPALTAEYEMFESIYVIHKREAAAFYLSDLLAA